MEDNQTMAVKDAVYKLQLSLLEGIKNEDQLFAAGSLMSRSDYEDVVVERSIANLCGYPLCAKSLPSDRPHKGKYRISLKEHRVYDLQETYMYCSSTCVVNSRAFAGSLLPERSSALNPSKIDEVLRLFENLSLDPERALEKKKRDLGFSNLRIQEKAEVKTGEVSLEQWIGPSNAIEGYVPQGDRISKSSSLKNRNEGSSAASAEPNGKKDCFFSDMNFMSTVITQDEYNISKTLPGQTDTASGKKLQEQKVKGTHKISKAQSSGTKKHDSNKVSSNLSESRSDMLMKEKLSSEGLPSPSNSCQISSSAGISEAEEKLRVDSTNKLSESMLKSSLKSSRSKKLNRSVTWADEKADGAGNGNLCNVKQMENTKAALDTLDSEDVGDDSDTLRFESAEACAIALSQAAEVVACGGVDVSDAMSDAGVLVLPRPHDSDRGDSMEDVKVEQESTPLKWPSKPGIPKSEYFDPEDSWYDDPPEGFNLELSPFATMWMALFAWVTSSSLAYIYGGDESSHEEYLMVNGREYPRKIVLRDGRSSEIKQTIEGCLARAFPGLVTDLRLSIPISTLEQGTGRLLDTMSFIDALPAFRMKQWQVIALLFLEALSVCRIPALTLHMSRRTTLHKVLDGARISGEEYEVMRDLIKPLGRAPHFSAQSGA